MEKILADAKKMIMMACCLLVSAFVSAQQKELPIEECYRLAKNNYPLLKQMGIIEKTKNLSLDNASKGYLPQISFSGQVTYQSDVTEIPVSIPGNSPLSKDQYKIYSELTQPITDIYTIKQQKELIKANSVSDAQALEAELYKLKDRINQVFFGMLVIDAQIDLTTILKNDIQAGIDKTDAAIANGIALKSNADVLKAELLKTAQRNIELKAARKGYADMLGLFINAKVDENTSLQIPVSQTISQNINRPELKYYDAVKKSIGIQSKLITARNIPRVNLYVQGGYGKPALNMLKNDFAFYYIGGIRFNWNLSGLYTIKNERRQLLVNQNQIDIQKEVFLFNTNLSLAQQSNEINKYKELIDTDNEIILLRGKVKTTANSQLENGTITANDFLSYVNTEDQAKQGRVLHQYQFLMAQYIYQSTSGN
ncbi:MAG: TolC family protein [Ferruginibacter sp.]